MFGDAINSTLTNVRRSMSIIASAGKNTVPGRGKSRSSKLSERHRVRKQNPRKSWVIRDMDGASEGEIESHLKRSKRYFTIYMYNNSARNYPCNRFYFYTTLLFNFSRSQSMGTSEDDSDYAYIDRSTHSITGYLQSPTNTNSKKSMTKDTNSFDLNQPTIKGHGAEQTATINLLLANSFESNGQDIENGANDSEIVDKMCSTTSFIDSPSPYATIQVLRKHGQHTKGIPQEKFQGNALPGQPHLIHQRPHPSGFHTLKV